MNKIPKRGKRILVMVLVFAILCTSLPCTPTISVHAAQTDESYLITPTEQNKNTEPALQADELCKALHNSSYEKSYVMKSRQNKTWYLRLFCQLNFT